MYFLRLFPFCLLQKRKLYKEVRSIETMVKDLIVEMVMFEDDILTVYVKNFRSTTTIEKLYVDDILYLKNLGIEVPGDSVTPVDFYYSDGVYPGCEATLATREGTLLKVEAPY